MSNFPHYPFELDGREWPTTEHYFQAMKFGPYEDAEGHLHPGSPEVVERIRAAATAMGAAKMGRNRQYPLRPDWDQARVDVMRRALRAKFTQNAGIREQLLQTYPRHIIEDSPTDYYWGCGADGTGENMLGQLLVELRNELKNE